MLQSAVEAALDLVNPFPVDNLSNLIALVAELRGSKSMCEDLLKRLFPVRDQLHKMMYHGNMEYSRALTEYAAVVDDFVYFLDEHVQCNFVMRAGRHWKVKAKIEEFHIKIDDVYKLLNLEYIAEAANRHQRMEAYHQEETAMLRQILMNKKEEVVSDLSRGGDAVLTLTDIKYQLKYNHSKYTKDQLKMMETTFRTAKKYAKVTVPSTPKWYISRSDIKFDANPFAASGPRSLHYGVWGAGTKVVIKFVLAEETDTQAREKFINETTIWFRLKNPHILRLYGACHVGFPLFFVSERAEQGNFLAYLANHKDRFWRVFHEIALGLAYLHQNEFVHSNLKCTNLLVKSDGTAVISDFWYSFVRANSALSVKEQVNSCHWKAPECLSTIGSVANPRFESDIYSLGMCLYEAMSGELPYGMQDDDTIVNKILAGELPPRTTNITDAAWNLITKMCRTEWKERMALDDVMKIMDNLARQEEMRSEMKALKVTNKHPSQSVVTQSTIVQQRPPVSSSLPSTPKWFISRSEIEVNDSPFATGAFRSIHHGIMNGGTKVIVKFILADEQDTKAYAKFVNETNVWYELRNPHIIQLFGACGVGFPFFFVSEKAENGNFTNYLPNNMHRFWRVFYDVAMGLAYLHRHKRVHNNLKCSNLLVKGDGTGVISDFWYSFARESSVLSIKEQSVTCHWKAPECLWAVGDTANPRFESDVYALGMCIYEAMSGELPYGMDDDDTIVDKILSGQLPPRIPKITDVAWELITNMCTHNWQQRMKLTDVIKRLSELAKQEMSSYHTRCDYCLFENTSNGSFCSGCGQKLYHAHTSNAGLCNNGYHGARVA